MTWNTRSNSTGASFVSTTAETRSITSGDRFPTGFFEQLFAADVTGLKLGERVEQEILAAAPERIPEFLQLNVRQGLDRREQSEAERFLDARPDGEEDLALKDILTPTTRRMVERGCLPDPRTFLKPADQARRDREELLHAPGKFRSGSRDQDGSGPRWS